MSNRAAWLATVTLILSMVLYGISVEASDLVVLLIPLMIAVRTASLRLGRALAPAWVVAVATVSALVYAAVRLLERGPEIEILGEFVAMLALLKCAELRTVRDDGQLLLVSVFLALAAQISSNALLTGVLLLTYVPLLGFTAMSLQVDAVRLLHKPIRAPAHERVRTRFAGTFAFAFAATLAMTSLTFVLLPRGVGDAAFRGIGRPAVATATGFRDSVELGRGGLISEDQTVVMQVQVRSARGRSLGADGRVFHLRGTALTDYSNGRWTRRREGNTRRNVGGVIFGGAGENPPITQVVELMPSASDSGVLFSLWQPERIMFDGFVGEAVVDAPRRTATLAGSLHGLTSYEVVSRAPLRIRAEGTAFRRRVPGFPNETVASIAENIARDAGLEPDPDRRPIAEDELLAEAIEEWLRVGGGFSYTLDVLDAEPGVDPIEWFLTDVRSGHCEYFASAMAAMCRTVGINTRVVTGYVMAEYDEAEEAYVVRRANAHAWVEAETAPGRWLTYDPTPGVSELHTSGAGNTNRLRRLLAAVEGFWLTSIVSYDQGQQLSMFDFFRSKDQSRNPPGEPDANRRLGSGARIAALVFASGLTGVLVWRWLRRPRRVGRHSAAVELPVDAATVRRRLLRHWKRTGRERPGWAGLVAHADRTGTPAESELAHLLTAVAFGARPWGRPEAEQSAALLRRVLGTGAGTTR